MEAAGLGLFMLSACAFGTLLESPASPVRQALPDPFVRRFLMGLAMAVTAINIIYSPWGKQSGAHLNPSVTLTFFRLGKVASWDALFYVTAQFIGGMAGVLLAEMVLGQALAEPPCIM
jgi:aquaporin Z